MLLTVTVIEVLQVLRHVLVLAELRLCLVHVVLRHVREHALL